MSIEHVIIMVVGVIFSIVFFREMIYYIITRKR